MIKYLVWAKIGNYQTVHSYVWANNDHDAKLIAEAQFGVGNILNWTAVSEN